ncbi:MAG: hypothetical protein OXS35_06165, partial [Dehalococcoidia bacterium]|nr:hypothetical protein [Dehalococcoidia bacterium]
MKQTTDGVGTAVAAPSRSIMKGEVPGVVLYCGIGAGVEEPVYSLNVVGARAASRPMKGCFAGVIRLV